MSDPNQEFQPPPPPPPFNPQPDPPARPTRYRPFAIGIFVVGLIILALGIAKVLPGGFGTGAAFAFWGILLFAFSFIRLPQTTATDEPPMSGVQKLIGIFFEPSRVFGNLRAHPRWLAAFLVIVLVNIAYTTAFVQRLTPERIVNHTFEKMEQSPIKPPPDQMEQAKEDAMNAAKQPLQRIQGAAKTFVGWFAFVSFVAALCFLGVLAFGGRMNFWQAFAAVLYGYLPVVVISKLVSLLILFLKDPDSIHPILGQETLLQDNLGILFAPGEHPALFSLAVNIGVLSFYGLWLRAKGLAIAGQKVGSSAAWGVAITLWVLALILGMIFATLFASFIS
jgi:hypothetical protein